MNCSDKDREAFINEAKQRAWNEVKMNALLNRLRKGVKRYTNEQLILDIMCFLLKEEFPDSPTAGVLLDEAQRRLGDV